MCKHDIVIMESGLADFGLPFTQHVSFARNRVRSACASKSATECESALAPALRGEDWRRRPLTAYKQRVALLLDVWQRCGRIRPHFRGIFKLAPAPRARQRAADAISRTGGSRRKRTISRLSIKSQRPWSRAQASRRRSSFSVRRPLEFARHRSSVRRRKVWGQVQDPRGGGGVGRGDAGSHQSDMRVVRGPWTQELGNGMRP